MNGREILVADSDTVGREQMTETLRKAGYHVETTDSTVHVFCTVLEKQIPVVLLGSGCDKKIALADLVALLNKCNRGVTIILVSDEESVPVIRSIREKGIFYHALKPANREDTAEILTAVEYAFRHTEKNDRVGADSRTQTFAQPVVPPAPCAVPMTAGRSPVASPAPARAAVRREPRRWRGLQLTGKTAAILTVLMTALAGFVCCVIAATKGSAESGELAVWGFLGFCALIIVGQMIPLYVSFKSSKEMAEQRIQEELATAKKQEAHAASDKND